MFRAFNPFLRSILLRGSFLILAFSVWVGASAQAPTTRPYLVQATIHLAVNNEADVWLNGVHIAHYFHTTPEQKFRVLEARPDSLCYFKDDNVLAISVQAAKTQTKERYVGVAYFMFLRFSDGSTLIFDSSDAEEHRSYYLPHRAVEAPKDWQTVDFDDTQWAPAQGLGNRIPETGDLTGGNFGRVTGFLSATPEGYFAKYAGEKHLFRRRFHLDIATNPRCLPKPLPIFNRKPRRGNLGAITPVVIPSKRQPLAEPPQLSVPHPALQKRVYLPSPTWTPMVVFVPPTPTNTLPPLPTDTPVPPPVFTAIPVSPTNTPYYTPTVIVQDDGAIVFGQNTANILAVFGDGPGYYKVEAVDDQMRHLKTIFTQHIIAPSEMWLSWDGKDDSGQDVPNGEYYILCSKEGLVLQKIILRRVSQMGQ